VYGYRILTTILAAVWLLLWISRPDLRSKLLVSSLAGAPLGLTNPLFVPDYWDPFHVVRVLGLFDLESVVFSFFVGGVAACAYLTIARVPAPSGAPPLAPYHLGACAGLMAIALGALVSQKLLGPLPTILTLHLGALVGIAYAWTVRSDLIRLSVLSAAAFAALYLAALTLTDALVPYPLHSHWTGYATAGLYIGGLPVDEILYAALFAAVWSVVYEIGESLKGGLRRDRERGWGGRARDYARSTWAR
jgi:hypothetical protein